MRDDFVADVTDEIRTPLVSIKGYVDYILNETSLPDEAASHLKVVKRNTDRLLRLTEDLVDIRRVQSGTLQLNLQPINLREVIEKAAEEIKLLTDAKQQTLHLQAPEEPLPVQGDPDRVAVVLSNLLSNAYQFTPEHGEITIVAKMEDDEVSTAVQDTGIGIRPEDLARSIRTLPSDPEVQLREGRRARLIHGQTSRRVAWGQNMG